MTRGSMRVFLCVGVAAIGFFVAAVSDAFAVTQYKPDAKLDPVYFTLSQASSEIVYESLQREEVPMHDFGETERLRKVAYGTLSCKKYERMNGELEQEYCLFSPVRQFEGDIYQKDVRWDVKGLKVASEVFEKMPVPSVLDYGWHVKTEYAKVICERVAQNHRCRIVMMPRVFTTLKGLPCTPEFDKPSFSLDFHDDEWVRGSYYDYDNKVSVNIEFYYEISPGNLVTFWHGKQKDVYRIIHQGSYLVAVEGEKWKMKGYFSCYPRSMEVSHVWDFKF